MDNAQKHNYYVILSFTDNEGEAHKEDGVKYATKEQICNDLKSVEDRIKKRGFTNVFTAYRLHLA